MDRKTMVLAMLAMALATAACSGKTEAVNGAAESDPCSEEARDEGEGAKVDVAACEAGGTGPLAIAVSAPATVENGKPTRVEWSVANAPPGSSVGLYLVHDAPDGESWRLPGTTGPLMLRAVNLCGVTRGTALWDAASVGCAPTDAAQLCNNIQPGSYRIVATVLDRADAGLTPSRGSNRPKAVGKGDSAPFTIVGNTTCRGD